MKCRQCKHEHPDLTPKCSHCGANLFRAKLRIVRSEEKHETRYLFEQNYTVGRGRDNDIVIRDESISRQHAELHYADGVFTITDLNSKNGSLLNNLMFKSRVLRNQDCIQLGNIVLYFYCDEEPVANATRFDTLEFVQKEYVKLSEVRRRKIGTPEALQTVLNLIVALVNAEEGALILVSDDSHFELKVRSGLSNGRTDIQTLVQEERELFDRALQLRAAQIDWNNAVVAPEDTSTKPLAWNGMAIPLLSTLARSDENGAGAEQEPFGLCYLSHKKRDGFLSRRKKELLASLVRQIALALENERLQQVAGEETHSQDERMILSGMQQRLLPVMAPSSDQLSVVTFSEPCETISGDYFDVLPISENAVGFAIGDICGKGAPAALLSSTTQAAIRSQIEDFVSPQQVVETINHLFVTSTSNAVFLTMFFGVLNLQTGELTYVNAGHPPPICISAAREIIELSGTTPPLGILDNTMGTQKTIPFGRGDTIIMYTDGIIESKNSENQLYGRKRFIELVCSIYAHPKATRYNLDYVVGRVKADLTAFSQGVPQADDLTLLAVKRKH